MSTHGAWLAVVLSVVACNSQVGVDGGPADATMAADAVVDGAPDAASDRSEQPDGSAKPDGASNDRTDGAEDATAHLACAENGRGRHPGDSATRSISDAG